MDLFFLWEEWQISLGEDHGVETSEDAHTRPLRGLLTPRRLRFRLPFTEVLSSLSRNLFRKEVGSMPTYIGLYKLTDQGIKNIKDAPKRIEEGIKRVEAVGGKVIGFYTVLGEYDYVAIGEFPNDQVAVALALAMGSEGNVRTKTLKAFTREEFAEIVMKLP
jgi:uncharacterized protein with GYD domain